MFLKQLFFRGCCLLAAAAFGGHALAQAGVADDRILIGQSAPLTGANAELGKDIRDGALAYFASVNSQGGVHGRRIELVSLDDGNEAKRSGENTKVLLDEKKVFALFGYGSATLSRPALPLVNQQKVPFFAPFTGAEPMRAFNRYVFNLRASYADEAEKFVGHMATLGIQRISVLHYNDAVGKENFAVVERSLKKHGMSVASVAAIERNSPTLGNAVKTIMQADPQVVIMTTLYKPSADFVRQARKAGHLPQFTSISFVGASPFAKELGPDGVGVAVSQVVPFPWKASLPIVREYQKAMEKFTPGSELSFTSLESFIAAKVMVEGLRQAGRALTREKFIAALESMNRFDAGGYAVSFSPDSHNGSRFVDLTVISSAGKFRN